MKENKKGISLIVLVITIIVMIILAATVIISLTGNSVIDRANEAVDKTNEANVQQLASTLWAEAYLDGVNTKEGFTTKIKDGLDEAGIATSEYAIIATTSGVTVKKGWAKDGFTVVKGDQVLEIGDVVNYDETAGGTIEFGEDNPNPDDVKWKVLGSDEDGNLLLMSTVNIVDSYRLGYEKSMTNSAAKLEETQNDWINVAAELDGPCEPYGYGKGVVGKARSITVEDVDSVTGYDKTTYGKGTVSQYGNEVTYLYNETTKPAYTSKVKSGVLTSPHSNGFHYYDGKEFKVANDLASKTSGTITTLKNDIYSYNVWNLTTINPEDNAKACETIFVNDGKNYWLASPYVWLSTNVNSFGVYYVDDMGVYYYDLWFSNGGANAFSLGVRAVVTLSSDITFTGNSTDGWTY